MILILGGAGIMLGADGAGTVHGTGQAGVHIGILTGIARGILLGTVLGITIGMQAHIGTGIGVIRGGDIIITDLCTIRFQSKVTDMQDQVREYIMAREILLLATEIRVKATLQAAVLLLW